MSTARQERDLDAQLAADEAWAHRACADADPELFFLKGGQRQALKLCRSCPARELCLEAVLVAEEGYGARWGVFGAKTAEQRASEITNASPRRVAS